MDCGDRTKVAAMRGQAQLARPEHVLRQVTHSGAKLQAFVCTLEEPCLCYSSSEEDLRRPVDHSPTGRQSDRVASQALGLPGCIRRGPPAEPGRSCFCSALGDLVQTWSSLCGGR